MNHKHNNIDCEHCSNRVNSLFCNLKSDEIDIINENKGCMIYKKGHEVFQEGGIPFGLFCINKGKVKLFQLGEDGKEQIIRFANEGDIIGYRALLSNDKYSATCTTLEDSSICQIPREIFFKLIEKNASLALQMLKLLGSNLKQAETKITELAQKPVRERVAEALLFLKETYGIDKDGVINVTLSREEIASIVGTATETTIRLLSEFKHDKLIELSGKKIKIINLKELVKTARVFD